MTATPATFSEAQVKPSDVRHVNAQTGLGASALRECEERCGLARASGGLAELPAAPWVSSEDLQCDISSWSCQMDPQPDPKASFPEEAAMVLGWAWSYGVRSTLLPPELFPRGYSTAASALSWLTSSPEPTALTCASPAPPPTWPPGGKG